MPKNSKPRKAKAQTIGAMLDQANKQKRQRYTLLNDRIRMKNNLPLAHPLNAWKLDKTFKPLLCVLAEQDEFGAILCDEEGRPLMRDEDDQDFMLLVPGVIHMCAVFDLIAAARVWGKQPPGLRAYVLKLANELPIVAGDTADARTTINWMRERLGSMTPVQWSDDFAAAVNRIAADDAREAA